MAHDADCSEGISYRSSQNSDEKCAFSSVAIRKLPQKGRGDKLRERKKSDEDAEPKRAMYVSKRRSDEGIRKKEYRCKDRINDGKAKVIQKISEVYRKKICVFFQDHALCIIKKLLYRKCLKNWNLDLLALQQIFCLRSLQTKKFAQPPCQ